MTNIMKNTTMKFTQLFFIAFAFVLFATNISFAQKSVDDPLKKPYLWAKLKANPHNEELWTEYVGKPLDKITAEEKSKIDAWKSKIEHDNATSVVFDSTDTHKNSEKLQYIAELENTLKEEGNEITRLKGNVSANFVIIEDTFRQMFKELNLEYVSYAQAHPDRKYSEVKWVEDNESKIRGIREKKLAELKEKYKIKNN